MPARAGLGSNGIEPGFSLIRSKTRKFVAQPLATRRRCAAITPHLIRLTGNAAFAGGPFNKLLGGIDPIVCHQVFVLVAQMRLCRFRVMPGAVAIKLASGTLQIAKQKIDFYLHACRRGRTRGGRRQKSQHQSRTQCQSYVHSCLSSGSSRNRSTFSLCPLLRAGSVSYSTAFPSSSVCQTKRGGLPPSRGSSVSV